MKILLTTFILLLACVTFGQITRDTILNYNGRQARMKMVFDKGGEKISDTVYHDNGKPETVYFYSDNKKIHWIAYDTLGTVIAEWQDPEIKNSKHRRMRNIALAIVSVLFISFSWLSSKKFGYKKTYFVIGYATISITVIAFFAQARIGNDANHFLSYLLSAMLLCFPVLLLALSVGNFFRKTGISVFVSVLFGLFCIWILLVYAMAILTAGVGILG